MCYNLAANKHKKVLEAAFDATFEAPEAPLYYSVTGFVHPALPVILNTAPHSIKLFRWGLIPSWIKSEEEAAEFRTQTLNARSETIFSKPAFRGSAHTKKCCVLVNGFYEWQTNGKMKQPYFIQLHDEAPFAMGGLWNEWVNPATGEIIPTFSIITVPANPLMAVIHNNKMRMPLIIPCGEERNWLAATHESETQPFLQPFDENLMKAHKVSKLVNGRSGNPNVPEVQQPLQEEIQGALF